MHYVSRARRHGVLALFAAILAVPVLFVSPASAHGNAAAVASSYCQTSAFGDQFSVGVSSTARGDVAREPSSSQTAEEVPANQRGKGGRLFSATVPVWFHVIHDGPIANVTDQQINEQIRVMNAGYSGAEGGYDTGFKFKLVGVDRTDNGLWLRHGFGDKYEREMKRTLHQGGRDTLNIYSTEASAYLGWAYFPNLSDSRLYLDGLVIDWESMPGTSTKYAGKYDLGKTATHESGHWFNLYHVFQGGCNNWGDYVADTPPQLIATYGCPEGQDSCSEPGLDSIHNYMDYSFDSCYDQFTAGQAARMQDAWSYFRANG